MPRRIILSVLSIPFFVSFLSSSPSSERPPDKGEFLRRCRLDGAYASPRTSQKERAFLDRSYELYVSSATPPATREWIRRRLTSHGRMKGLRERSGKRFPRAVSAAEASFRWGDVHVRSSPAHGKNPVFHMEVGLADRVEIRIYDAARRLIHQALSEGPPSIVRGRYAFEYEWDVSGAAGGVYGYALMARRGKKALTWKGTLAVVK